MRVVLAILALIGAFSAVPAKAADYLILQFSASGTGTSITVDCSIGDPLSCFVTTPGIYSNSHILGVEDWAGSTTFNYYSPGSYEGISGTLTKVAGGSIVGTNYSYFLDNGKSCTGQLICLNYRHIDFTAANFEVTQLSPAPVPEPATWAMLLVGFGLAGTALRRRQEIVPVWTRS